MTLQRSGGSSVGLGTKQRHQILVLAVASIRKGAVLSWFGRMNAILQRARRVRDCPQSRSLCESDCCTQQVSCKSRHGSHFGLSFTALSLGATWQNQDNSRETAFPSTWNLPRKGASSNGREQELCRFPLQTMLPAPSPGGAAMSLVLEKTAARYVVALSS